jgi:hypothetical protein
MPGLIVAPKFVWQRIVMALPASSPLFRHASCAGECRYRNGTQLSATAITSICFVVADAVRESDPESRAYRGAKSIAVAAKRDYHTVVMTLGHLQAVGLLDRTRRGGGHGVARGVPSVYSLTIPEPGLLALAKVDIDIMQKLEDDIARAEDRGTGPYYRWFERSA